MNKNIIVTGVGIVVIGLIIANFETLVEWHEASQPLVVQSQDKEVVIEEEKEVIDIIDAAKAELERINNELDAEETRLLEVKRAQQEVLDSKITNLEAQIKALENAHLEDEAIVELELERVRETRTSFQ